MQERVMFGPIFEPAIPPWCWSAGGGACDRVELPALLPRALRGHAPQEALRGSLINPDGVRWRVAFIISSPRNHHTEHLPGVQQAVGGRLGVPPRPSVLTKLRGNLICGSPSQAPTVPML